MAKDMQSWIILMDDLVDHLGCVGLTYIQLFDDLEEPSPLAHGSPVRSPVGVTPSHMQQAA